MPDSLACLLALAPEWSRLVGRGDQSSHWLASPPLPSGERVPAFLLRIWVEGGFLAAAEAAPGSRLPIVCPELHLPGKGVFCLAPGYQRCTSRAEVIEFWQDLGEYLVNQHFAARRRRWPAGRWLSHGPAALKAQLTAERAARAAGIAEEYARYLENGDGWIATAIDAPRPRRDEPCMRGCTTEADRVRSFGRCSRRHHLASMLAAERERQLGEAGYFAALHKSGVTCCGRMDHCPLRNVRDAA